MKLSVLKPRLRFSLRAILVLMTLLAVWCAYSMNWIRQRRQLIESETATPFWLSANVTAPGLLWIFGEVGHQDIVVNVRETDPEFDRIKALFPEAECSGNDDQDWHPSKDF